MVKSVVIINMPTAHNLVRCVGTSQAKDAVQPRLVAVEKICAAVTESEVK
jgi:hypothetical protein